MRKELRRKFGMACEEFDREDCLKNSKYNNGDTLSLVFPGGDKCQGCIKGVAYQAEIFYIVILSKEVNYIENGKSKKYAQNTQLWITENELVNLNISVERKRKIKEILE